MRNGVFEDGSIELLALAYETKVIALLCHHTELLAYLIVSQLVTVKPNHSLLGQLLWWITES